MAFLAASLIANPVHLIFLPLLGHRTPFPLDQLWLVLSGQLLLTGAVLAAFRWLRNDAGAAVLAAAIYSILQTANSIVGGHLFFGGPQPSPVFFVAAFLSTFLFLLILSLVVRSLRSIPVGLWIGSSAGRLASLLVTHLVNSLYLLTRGSSNYSLVPGPGEVLGGLLSAAIFAAVFWGALALMAPRVLQES